MQGELKLKLYDIARMKGYYDNVRIVTQDEYKDHFFGANGLALRMQACLVLAGMGKSFQPLIHFDPRLRELTKGRRFFSTCVGQHFERQRARVLDDLLNPKLSYGTLIFVDDYGLQKAQNFRPSLWLCNIAVNRRINKVTVTTTFGHCVPLPLLPYEIVGIATIVQWFISNLGQVGQVEYVWDFHSISVKETVLLDQPQVIFDTVPDVREVSEIIRLEAQMRKAKESGNKLAIQPMPRFPLSEQAEQLSNDIFLHWSNNDVD